MSTSLTIIGSLVVAFGGLLTAVFGALKFNRADAGETVGQFQTVLEGMRALLEETQKENQRSTALVLELRAEITKLELRVEELKETVERLRRAVAS